MFFVFFASSCQVDRLEYQTMFYNGQVNMITFERLQFILRTDGHLQFWLPGKCGESLRMQEPSAGCISPKTCSDDVGILFTCWGTSGKRPCVWCFPTNQQQVLDPWFLVVFSRKNTRSKQTSKQRNREPPRFHHESWTAEPYLNAWHLEPTLV